MGLQTQLQIMNLQLDLVKVQQGMNKAFNPEEPRDKSGKWSSSGSKPYLVFSHKEIVQPGEQYDHYHIRDVFNQRVGSVVLNVADPKHLYVEWVGKDLSIESSPENESAVSAFDKPLGLGSSSVRDIARQLKRLYPKAETISGDRVSGARHYGKPRDVGYYDSLATVRTSTIKRLQKQLKLIKGRYSCLA